MIRLIASDIDGTLVRESSHHINPEYFEVIRALKAKGIRFCACSGRQYQSILELFRPVADDIFFIAENGALLRTKNEIMFQWAIEEKYVHPLIADIRRETGADVTVSKAECAYTECGEDRDPYLFLKNSYKYAVEDLYSLDYMSKSGVLKLSLYHPTDAEGSCSWLYRSHWKNKLQILCSGANWVDICAMNAGKGEAYALLQEYLDIPKEETIYFGDNMNDLTAFVESGTSYTVANARTEVQSEADVVTASYKEHGVLQILKSFL
ncbi:MAG: HAD family hydrolase [Lachnospiraceae bacterium]|nr:HAD family hydrolase [Lachnospiraceae bacterium]